MIVFDTDHLSILQHPESPHYEQLVATMDQSGDSDFATTAISLEEQMRGWLAAINRARDVRRQSLYYSRLTGLVDFYGRWQVLPFDDAAASQFVALRKDRVQVGTMDLKIAAIAIVRSALLVSNNLRDFQRVPGLQVESWLS